MLTTGRYKGNPMAAHMQLPIEPHFFERWLALWQETAGEVFAPEPAAAFREKAEPHRRKPEAGAVLPAGWAGRRPHPGSADPTELWRGWWKQERL